MKTNSAKGKELVAQLQAAKVGTAITLPSPLPGIDSTKTQGFIRETQPDFWVIDLLWNGILYAEVTVQIMGDELMLEVL